MPWPERAEARAVARSVSAEMHSSFSALRNEAPMNLRRKFAGYQLSEAALADMRRIEAVWKYCREGFGGGGSWLFGEFTIADAMYAPVVMRLRSIAVKLTEVSMEYCRTVENDPSVSEWIRQAFAETHVEPVDELDWPSEPASVDGKIGPMSY